MMGRAALRCKKRGVKRCAARAAQKKPVPRSGTRNGPRDKEHIPTANTSGEGAHQQWIWSCQKWNKVVANSQNLRPKANKNGPRDCSKVPKSKQHRQQGVTDRKPTRKCAKLWLVSCKDCVHHADLQRAQGHKQARLPSASSGIAYQSINERQH